MSNKSEPKVEKFHSDLFMAIEDALRVYIDDIPRLRGGDNCIQHRIFSAVKQVIARHASKPVELTAEAKVKIDYINNWAAAQPRGMSYGAIVELTAIIDRLTKGGK